MFDNSPDNQAKPVRQNVTAPKEQEQPVERRWFHDALEDDEVYETLKSRREQEKAKSGANETNCG